MLKRASLAAVIAVTAALAVSGPSGVASATTPRQAVWFGSPMAGCSWPGTASAAQHTQDNAHYGYDWAADICVGKPTNSAVTLYAAPQTAGRNIRAFANTVASCAGSTVRVDFYDGTKDSAHKIGSVYYTHVNPKLASGTEIPKAAVTATNPYMFKQQIGTLYAAPGPIKGCWTGNHIHIAALNVANYACYTKEWRNGGTMGAGNFVGFIGGSYGSVAGPGGTRVGKACP